MPPQPQRLTREQKRQANRARLLTAAGGVFAARGYHGATVEQIAEESGLSNGALYYNFASKQELFLALMDERTNERIRALERTFGVPADPETTPEGEIRSATDEAARTGPEPQEWALFFEFVAHSGRDPDFRREFRKRLRKMRNLLARVTRERAETQGDHLSLPPEQIAIGMQALAFGLAAQRLADRPNVPPDMLGKLIIALLKGLTEDQAARK
jgi:AcrR family transcriptional regulator